MTTTPTWLRRHLADTRGTPPLGGVTRTITVGLCPTCQQQVVRGLDADWCALPVTVDPTPIDAVGEAIAAVTHRDTFDLVGTGRQRHLDRRDQWRIGSGRPRGPVLARHDCSHPLPPARTEPEPDPAAAAPWTDEPRF